jgi:hypothetical protein
MAVAMYGTEASDVTSWVALTMTKGRSWERNFSLAKTSRNCMKVIHEIIGMHGLPESFYMEFAGFSFALRVAR